MTAEPVEQLQGCASCRNFWVSPVGIVCRLAPPQPLVIGMTQGKPNLLQGGAPTVSPVIQGMFSPTAADNWCGQWRGRDFDGERPPLPVKPKQEYRT